MDKNLLNRLLVGHHAIIDSIDLIQLSSRNYQEVKPKLRAFQDQVLSHFAPQNNLLYDELSAFYEGNREKLKLIEFLSYDLRDIKVKTLVFIDQYPADMGDIRPVNFPKNFADFAAELSARIRSERQYLFPLIKEALS